jgi:hypothetical protein
MYVYLCCIGAVENAYKHLSAKGKNMGWQIAQKKGKYRIWSTNEDRWLTNWVDRNKVILFYYEHALFDLKKRTIEQFMLFPHHWTNYTNSRLIHDEEKSASYDDWMEQLIHKRDEEYCEFVEEAFDKIMKELDVAVE